MDTSSLSSVLTPRIMPSEDRVPSRQGLPTSRETLRNLKTPSMKNISYSVQKKSRYYLRQQTTPRRSEKHSTIKESVAMANKENIEHLNQQPPPTNTELTRSSELSTFSSRDIAQETKCRKINETKSMPRQSRLSSLSPQPKSPRLKRISIGPILDKERVYFDLTQAVLAGRDLSALQLTELNFKIKEALCSVRVNFFHNYRSI